jgi:hypothetical protein
VSLLKSHFAPIVVIALVAVGGGSGHAQTKPSETDASRPPAEYESHSACVNCHRELPTFAEDFIKFIQKEVWEDKDKHSQAFNLLLSDESQPVVTRLLGFDLREFVRRGELNLTALQPSQRTRLKSCLHCHSAWPKDEDQPPIAAHWGVNCQACHGPARSWFAAHQRDDKMWRLVTPTEKARLHMTDVHDPITRTQLCASCHIGNLKQGRFVTHEMYVLGHPPLPNVEPESFAKQMPEHWQTLRQKLRDKAFDMWDSSPEGLDRATWSRRNSVLAEEIKNSYREANYPDFMQHDPLKDLPQTRQVMVGGMVVLQSSLELLADLAESRQSSDSLWPEFAMYDCRSCHHDLRSGPLATGRPFRQVPPGRPSMPLWPTVLVRAGMVQKHGNLEAANQPFAEFERDLRSVELAVTRPVFGDAQQIQTAARALAKKLDILASELTQSHYRPESAKLALLVLTEPNQTSLRDYHSARQVAWAIRRIATELAEENADFKIESLFLGPNGEDILALNLPSGQNNSVLTNLGPNLKAAANYDPDWLARELARLRTAVMKLQ